MNDEQGLSRVLSIVLLVATALLGWISIQDFHEVPSIVGDRNSVTVPATEQNITARLWEDPLQAVQSEIATLGHAAPGIEVVRKSVVSRINRSRNVCLILVPIPATPFPDDSEVRLRLRYSAQMALAHENFAPENRDALGSFKLLAGTQSILQGPTASNQTGHINVPYEWFVPRQKNSNLDLLVLWLPEQYLGEETLFRLGLLAEQLTPIDSPAMKQAVVGLFVVGPRSSDTLKRMVPPPMIGPPHPRVFALKGKLCIFSPQATTPDSLLGFRPAFFFAVRHDLFPTPNPTKRV